MATVRILNEEDEIYAHFSGTTLESAIHVAENNWHTYVLLEVVETDDKTTDSSCKSDESYKRSGTVNSEESLFPNSVLCLCYCFSGLNGQDTLMWQA